MPGAFQGTGEATSYNKNMPGEATPPPSQLGALQQLSPFQGFMWSLCAPFSSQRASQRTLSGSKCTQRFVFAIPWSPVSGISQHYLLLPIQSFIFTPSKKSKNRHELPPPMKELIQITWVWAKKNPPNSKKDPRYYCSFSLFCFLHLPPPPKHSFCSSLWWKNELKLRKG